MRQHVKVCALGSRRGTDRLVNNLDLVPIKGPHEIHGGGTAKGGVVHVSYGGLRKLAPSAIVTFWFPFTSDFPDTSLCRKARG